MNRESITDNRVTLLASGLTPYASNTRHGLYFIKSQAGGDDPLKKSDENGYLMQLTWKLDAPYQKWNNSTKKWVWYTTESSPAIVDWVYNWSTNENNSLLSGLNDRVERGGWDPATSLGETGEAFRMIGDRAKSFAAAFAALKRGRVGDALRHVGINKTNFGRKRERYVNTTDAAKTFLEHSYGWSPLLSDIRDASQYITDRLGASPVRKVKGPYAKRYFERDLVPAAGSVNVTRPSRCTIIRRYYAEIDCGQPPSPGIIDPLIPAWNLLPTSFIVDWFIPVNQWLGALDLSQAVASGAVKLHRVTFKTRWAGPARAGPAAKLSTSSLIAPEIVQCLRKEVYVYREPNLSGASLRRPPTFRWVDGNKQSFGFAKNLVALALANGRSLKLVV